MKAPVIEISTLKPQECGSIWVDKEKWFTVAMMDSGKLSVSAINGTEELFRGYDKEVREWVEQKCANEIRLNSGETYTSDWYEVPGPYQVRYIKD